MMDIWLSASELAGLPGWPSTSRRAKEKAKREGLLSRPRRGFGGGEEYHISGLSPEAQAVVTQHFQASAMPPLTPIETTEATEIPTEVAITPEPQPPQPQTSAKAQQRADAKIWILQQFNLYQKEAGIPITDCQSIFAVAYNKGEIETPEWVKAAIDSLSSRTLRRWLAQVKAGELTALAGKYGNRKGKNRIDEVPTMRDLIIGMICQFPHSGAAHIHQALFARFEPEIIPSLRTLERWIAAWKDENLQTFTAVSNPDQWKSKYMVAFGKYSEGINHPNQLWEIDSTPADILLTDGRYSIIGLIDVFSRQTMLLVTKTSKATAIAALLRRSLLNWGVPESIKTDNGADYTSNHIRRILVGLNVQHNLCQPFQPWQKPHIERFFRTFSHDLLELTPGFIGHNVADRHSNNRHGCRKNADNSGS